MFDRLVQRFKRRQLSRLASGWLALEAARLVAPLYALHWRDCPSRYPANLRWAHMAIVRHLTGQDTRPRYIRLATLKAYMAAGGAIKADRVDVATVANVTAAATRAADLNRSDWHQELLEALSFFDDCAYGYGLPDMTTELEKIRLQIKQIDSEQSLARCEFIPAELIKTLETPNDGNTT